jgi:opacity protein-like surface antigen
VEAFTSKPTIKSQSVSTKQDLTYLPLNPLPPSLCLQGISCQTQVTNYGTLALSESSMRLITVAFNVVARYPGKVFQPYVGVGAGAFYFTSSSGPIQGRQVVPGLNAMAGLKVLATEEWGFFLEGKYNRATITNFDPTFGLSGEYSSFNAVAGLAYHF